MIKAVIYDVDGMVLHGMRFSDRYAKEFGIPSEAMAPFFTGPFEKCVIGQADLKEELTNGGWLEKWQWRGTVDELLEYWFHSGDTIDERVLESAANLRAKGIICIIATSQEKYRAEYIRDTLGLWKHFDAVFHSSELGYRKPHPEFLQKVMEYMDVRNPSIRKSDVLFWDDKEMCVAGATSFGFDARQFKNFEDYKATMDQLVA